MTTEDEKLYQQLTEELRVEALEGLKAAQNISEKSKVISELKQRIDKAKKSSTALATLTALKERREALATQAEEEDEENEDTESDEEDVVLSKLMLDDDNDLLAKPTTSAGQVAKRIGELEAQLNEYVGVLVTPKQREHRTYLQKRINRLKEFAKIKFTKGKNVLFWESLKANVPAKPPASKEAQKTDVPFWQRLSEAKTPSKTKKPAKVKEVKEKQEDDLEPKLPRPKSAKDKKTQRILMPQKHVRAMLTRVLEMLGYDKTLRLDKNFVRDINEQFYDWIRAVMHSLELTLHNTEEALKKDKIVCAKTITVEAVIEAIELVNPGSTEDLGRQIANIRDQDESYMVVRGRIRNAMRDFEGGNRRVTKEAVDLLRDAMIVRAHDVLYKFAEIMMEKGRVLFKSCPSFVARTYDMDERYGEAIGFVPGDFEHSSSCDEHDDSTSGEDDWDY